jgi:hypothetical protein
MHIFISEENPDGILMAVLLLLMIANEQVISAIK